MLFLQFLESLEYIFGDIHNMDNFEPGILNQILKIVLLIGMDNLPHLQYRCSMHHRHHNLDFIDQPIQFLEEVEADHNVESLPIEVLCIEEVLGPAHHVSAAVVALVDVRLDERDVVGGCHADAWREFLADVADTAAGIALHFEDRLADELALWV